MFVTLFNDVVDSEFPKRLFKAAAYRVSFHVEQSLSPAFRSRSWRNIPSICLQTASQLKTGVYRYLSYWNNSACG